MDERLARDLIELWQSELTALSADREARENFAALLALWARAANAAFTHDPARGTAPLQPPRAASTSVASDPGVDEIARLRDRIAELERRLGGSFEPGTG